MDSRFEEKDYIDILAIQEYNRKDTNKILGLQELVVSK